MGSDHREYDPPNSLTQEGVVTPILDADPGEVNFPRGGPEGSPKVKIPGSPLADDRLRKIRKRKLNPLKDEICPETNAYGQAVEEIVCQ